MYNWVTSELYGILKAAGSTSAEMPITPSQLRELVELVDTAVLSGLLAKKVLAVMVDGDARGPRTIADEMGLVQISDTGEIDLMCQQVGLFFFPFFWLAFVCLSTPNPSPRCPCSYRSPASHQFARLHADPMSGHGLGGMPSTPNPTLFPGD